MSDLVTPEAIIERVPEWTGKTVEIEVLHGGLANRSYLAEVEGDKYVLKAITRAMDEFGLMIPVPDICHNTEASGHSVNARTLHVFEDLPALVMEFIEGVTLQTADLSTERNIPRLGRAVRRLHTETPRFNNEIQIWKFLQDYLDLMDKYTLEPPTGLADYLPMVRKIEEELVRTRQPFVPSHNDLLPLNVMDDGEIRLIDYDFSGMNDPMFDLGDLAMEGLYDPDQLARLCESYFDAHDPVQVARARLFGIAAQYTWSLLFVGMHHLLPEPPDEEFDYYAEAESRWAWTKTQLDADDVHEAIKVLE